MYKVMGKLSLVMLPLNSRSLGKSPEGQARLSVTKKKAKRGLTAKILLKLRNQMPYLQNLIMQKRSRGFWDRGRARKEVGSRHRTVVYTIITIIVDTSAL